jgi:hypothetical protein
MPTTYKIIPASVAAVVYVQRSDDVMMLQPCVFISHEKGIVYGQRDVPLADSGLPQQVIESIEAHFVKVFLLEHEDWAGPGPSPRARYVETAKSWSITAENTHA